MKNNLDERQKQTVGNYMAGSCLVMLAGGVIYIVGEIKAGSFSNYGRAAWKPIL